MIIVPEEETTVFKKIERGFKNKILDGYAAYFPKYIPISNEARDLISGQQTSKQKIQLIIIIEVKYIIASTLFHCIRIAQI